MAKQRLAGIGGGIARGGGVRGRWTQGQGGGGGGTAKGGAGRKRPRPQNAAIDGPEGAGRDAAEAGDGEFLVAEYDSGAEGGAGGGGRESSDEDGADGGKGGRKGGKVFFSGGDEEEEWGDLGLRQVRSLFRGRGRLRKFYVLH